MTARIERNMGVGAGRAHGVGPGIDDDATAPVVVRHPEGELEHEAQELNAESLPLHRLVDPKPGEPEDRQGVPRQLLARAGRQPVDLNVGGGDGGKTKHAPVVDGDIGDAQVRSTSQSSNARS